MSKRRLFISLSLALAFAALPWGIDQASAQSQEPGQRQTSPETTITDAAGRTHTVMPMRRITQEQRKAAAERRKGLAAHTGHKKQNTPTAPGEVMK